jgi:hypothetical protein
MNLRREILPDSVVKDLAFFIIYKSFSYCDWWKFVKFVSASV